MYSGHDSVFKNHDVNIPFNDYLIILIYWLDQFHSDLNKCEKNINRTAYITGK